MSFKDELLEKYKLTGKIGFVKPKSLEEALDLINVLDGVNSQPPKEVVSESVVEATPDNDEEVYTLSEITERMKKFFKL